MILISACLAGIDCKYSGGNNLREPLKKLYEEGRAVIACPEQLGGLPTPRASSEIQNGRVVNTVGIDVTGQFEEGARKSLQIFRENGCTMAVLKACSPSCGCGMIYDGTFSHTRIPGDGIFTQLLKKEGIPCMSDEEYLAKYGNSSDD